MTAMFRTESDVMLATAGRVDTTNSEVQGELTRLQGVVDGVRGSWAGSAQVSFDQPESQVSDTVILWTRSYTHVSVQTPPTGCRV